MKILGLRFKNLNALRGQWAIDFTDPAYETEGIFAITGPTGAGKTTLLDAICLALYGQTPRLGPITSSQNELMSRHTGACFAEVVFATQSGRYCCHWAQHRAYKRADGALQTPRHELSNADTGEIIAESLREVEREVVALTGLSYQQFTRSILLAQGGFAAFLQAGPDERAPLLEQITGTEIYARISMRVHEQRQKAEQHWQALQAELQRIELLDEDTERALRAELETQTKQQQACDAALERTRAALQWRQDLTDLQADLDELARAEASLQEDERAFAPQARKLERAQKALSFESEFLHIRTARAQLQQNQQKAVTLQQALPAIEKQLKEARRRCQAARAAVDAHQNTHEAQQALWQQVEALDAELLREQERLQQEQAELQRRTGQLQQLAAERDQAIQAQANVQQQLQELQHYAQKHAHHADLQQALGGIEFLIEQVRTQQTAVQALQKARAQCLKEGEQVQKAYDQAAGKQQQARQATARLEAERDRLQQNLNALLQGSTLSQLRTQVEDAREQMQLRLRIASLEEQRQHLQAGQPCPLCGSLEHPYAGAQLPAVTHYQSRLEARKEQLARAESYQEHIEQSNIALIKQGQMEQAAGQQLIAEKAQLQAQKRELENLEQRLEQEQAQITHSQQRLAERLQTLKIDVRADEDPEALLQRLRGYEEQWRAHDARRQQLQKQEQPLAVTLQGLQQEYHTREEEERRVRQAVGQLQTAHEQLRARRTHLFGQASPQQARQQWQEELQRLQAALAQAEQNEQEYTQQQRIKEAERDSLKEHIEASGQQLAQQKTAFIDQIRTQGFVDWADFVAARLPAEERSRLTAQSHQLEQRRIRYRATRTEREQRLQKLQERALTQLSLEALKVRRQEQEAARQQAQTRCTELSHQLQRNEEARVQQQKQHEAVKKQQQELKRWQELHQLIGSADGKKFRNFAQGLSFAQLVYYANQQMQTMSDRYALLQDQHEPLHLNVMDNYQGGVVRSTKNLSGGESFIVSLALALGLSRMASQNVRIDSLFLDEGFGTLDDEALALALDTLANLQQESKSIGVISHVPALKERIGTQIVVQTNKTGWSTLHGPGCVQEHE